MNALFHNNVSIYIFFIKIGLSMNVLETIYLKSQKSFVRCRRTYFPEKIKIFVFELKGKLTIFFMPILSYNKNTIFHVSN